MTHTVSITTGSSHQARPWVTYYVNYGPTARHMAHDIRAFDRLRDARAFARELGRDFVIVRAEDRRHRPGERRVVEASCEAWRRAGVGLCASINGE